jgi:murein DD-endopeptidase MepM/ murein hydrolase activator NlpD
MTQSSVFFRTWLDTQTEKPAEIITGIQGQVHHLRLDAEGLAARGWSDLSKDWVPAEGELYAGGYLEDRAIYNSPVFAGVGDEPRTLHLGVDIFASAETQVFAPVEGFVHSVQVNAGDLDYGPTIILQHEPANGPVFWTLYGHLSEESLFGLEEGDLVSRGETLAELGDVSVNGGWATHLHFQIMLDIQGRTGDFPGVCKLSEREQWEALCPSPYAFLGLTL